MYYPEFCSFIRSNHNCSAHQIFLKLILPIVAYAAGGRLGLKFAKLYGTYKLWPENKKLESKLLEKFTSVEFEKDLMGGAIMVAAYK